MSVAAAPDDAVGVVGAALAVGVGGVVTTIMLKAMM